MCEKNPAKFVYISHAFHVITNAMFVSLEYDTLKTVTRVTETFGVINKTVQLNILAAVHLLVSVRK